MKRVLTIQDISCLGKCSMTIALPILSVLGAEAVILPTSMLSAHTAFKDFTFKDLSDQIDPITEQWKRDGISFDAIYTGYLGTMEDIEKIRKLFQSFRSGNTMIIVDPAMADQGKLYAGFDMEYVRKNAELCSDADIIIPNMTEASLMTGIEYKEEYDEEYVRTLLEKVSGLGAEISILTGVSMEKDKIGVMGYNRTTGEYYVYQHQRVGGIYHGAGDLFSSTFVGEIVRGYDWRDAVRIAADYTVYTIEETVKDPDRRWYGVSFETTISHLLEIS